MRNAYLVVDAMIVGSGIRGAGRTARDRGRTIARIIVVARKFRGAVVIVVPANCAKIDCRGVLQEVAYCSQPYVREEGDGRTVPD